mmetsp:Transcript_5349/g.12112  ORF Transcript_5349/g.12112 Transcript_5349/m.12112 type:complete len:836 (+) Transcript_5349:46-2553(+)
MGTRRFQTLSHQSNVLRLLLLLDALHLLRRLGQRHLRRPSLERGRTHATVLRLRLLLLRRGGLPRRPPPLLRDAEDPLPVALGGDLLPLPETDPVHGHYAVPRADLVAERARRLDRRDPRPVRLLALEEGQAEGTGGDAYLVVDVELGRPLHPEAVQEGDLLVGELAPLVLLALTLDVRPESSRVLLVHVDVSVLLLVLLELLVPLVPLLIPVRRLAPVETQLVEPGPTGRVHLPPPVDAPLPVHEPPEARVALLHVAVPVAAAVLGELGVLLVPARAGVALHGAPAEADGVEGRGALGAQLALLLEPALVVDPVPELGVGAGRVPVPPVLDLVPAEPLEAVLPRELRLVRSSPPAAVPAVGPPEPDRVEPRLGVLAQLAVVPHRAEVRREPAQERVGRGRVADPPVPRGVRRELLHPVVPVDHPVESRGLEPADALPAHGHAPVVVPLVPHPPSEDGVRHRDVLVAGPGAVGLELLEALVEGDLLGRGGVEPDGLEACRAVLGQLPGLEGAALLVHPPPEPLVLPRHPEVSVLLVERRQLPAPFLPRRLPLRLGLPRRRPRHAQSGEHPRPFLGQLAPSRPLPLVLEPRTESPLLPLGDRGVAGPDDTAAELLVPLLPRRRVGLHLGFPPLGRGGRLGVLLLYLHGCVPRRVLLHLAVGLRNSPSRHLEPPLPPRADVQVVGTLDRHAVHGEYGVAGRQDARQCPRPVHGDDDRAAGRGEADLHTQRAGGDGHRLGGGSVGGVGVDLGDGWGSPVGLLTDVDRAPRRDPVPPRGRPRRDQREAEEPLPVRPRRQVRRLRHGTSVDGNQAVARRHTVAEGAVRVDPGDDRAPGGA